MTRAANLPAAARNLDLPLSRFPLRGHRRLRCAAARAQHRPIAKRSSAFWAGREEMLFTWGLRRPQTPARCDSRTSKHFILQTGQIVC